MGDAVSGDFLDCAEPPRLSSGMGGLGPGSDWTLPQEPPSGILGSVCVLPLQYDFCVSYPALVRSFDSQSLVDILAAQFSIPEAAESVTNVDFVEQGQLQPEGVAGW